MGKKGVGVVAACVIAASKGGSSMQLMATASSSSSSSAKAVDLMQSPDLMSAASVKELLALMRDMADKLGDFRSIALQKVKTQLGEAGRSTDHGDEIVDYLECKQQILLAYCQHLVYYLSLKARGESVRAHPVMNQMLELRYAMEKMRPIDGKLHYQIDRLIKLSTLDEKEVEQASLWPNPMALMAKDGGGNDDDDEDDGFDYAYAKDDDDEDDDDEDDEDNEDGRRSKKKSHSRRQDKESGSGNLFEAYRAPRMAAVPFKEREDQAARREKNLQKTRRKLKNSEILDTLREEFSTAPDKASSLGISGMSGEDKRLAAEAAERTDYEENRFVRMTMSRRTKQDIKRRTTEAGHIDNMNDIGDFDNLDELTKLSGGSSKTGRGKVAGADTGDDDHAPRRGSLLTAGGSAMALQKAVKALRSTACGDEGQRPRGGEASRSRPTPLDGFASGGSKAKRRKG